MVILGISAYFHDSAAAFLINGELQFAAEEERFSRIKHDASFPIKAIKAGLDHCQIQLEDIDYVVFYEKPFLKFERILESYYKIAPKGLLSFAKSMPMWFGDKLMIKSKIIKALKPLGNAKALKNKLKFTEHHLAHAASTFYPSSFKKAAILTIDGVGEWATATICKGEGHQIELLEELHYPHSVGLLYSAFTQFLGFKVNSGEYKLMGLAAYGNLEAEETKNFIELIKTKLVTITDTGAIRLHLKHFRFHSSLKTISVSQWEKLFQINVSSTQDNTSTSHANLALAIQKVTEEIVLKMATHAKHITGLNHICLSGGVALNCVANGVLERAKLFKNIFIQPASGDAGGAVGAALAYHFIALQQDREEQNTSCLIQHSLLGPSLHDEEIETLLQQYQLDLSPLRDVELFETIADHLANHSVIGWCQGRMEFGPRALGNRSILADPRDAQMQQIVNLKVKKRESFRPFAPALLADKAHIYFGDVAESPYMLSVHPILPHHRLPLPEGYSNLSPQEKLAVPKSNLPSITHADFTARLQTVTPSSNPRFHALIEAFEQRTGYPMLINTSFNERGEPIVNTARDAFHAFMRTSIDVLVLNNYLIEKKDVAHLPIEDFAVVFQAD